MATAQTAVSDMLVTVKSREVQRGMLAEARGDHAAVVRHFRAAAHLELVLAGDYDDEGDPDMAFRSRISAASALWRAGDHDESRRLLEMLAQQSPGRAADIRSVRQELESSGGADKP